MYRRNDCFPHPNPYIECNMTYELVLFELITDTMKETNVTLVINMSMKEMFSIKRNILKNILY